MSFFERLFNGYDRNTDPRDLESYQLQDLASQLVDKKRLESASYSKPNWWDNGQPVTNYYDIKNIPDSILRNTLQWAQMSQTKPYRKYEAFGNELNDVTPSFEEAYNQALLDNISKIYKQIERGEIGEKPIQTKTGEYMYRLLNPDELIVPFATSYNEEQKY